MLYKRGVKKAKMAVIFMNHLTYINKHALTEMTPKRFFIFMRCRFISFDLLFLLRDIYVVNVLFVVVDTSS